MKPVEEILWANHTRGEFPEWAARNTVVIVPIASTEQHGLHLPEDTDQRTVEYVSREAARRLDIPVLVTPTIPIGVSPHTALSASSSSAGMAAMATRCAPRPSSSGTSSASR
jgi:creatinine amidohydrolase/Fe(II)-dependent formamide hydrolase-like protein